MIYEVMDVRKLTYEDNFFDIAIDKSTIDALLCGDHAFFSVAEMLKEVQRVLKVGGWYMGISYGMPDNRLDHFTMPHLNWDTRVKVIGEAKKAEDEEESKVEQIGDIENDEKANLHYVYICQKKEGWEEAAEQNWKLV